MKNSTRMMKAALENDLRKMHQHNNSKADRRTDLQNAQSREARKDFYMKKWRQVLASAETAAQKNYCEIAIAAAACIR